MKSTELSLLALVITLFAVLVQAPTASAVTVHTYNGTAAAAYAEEWSCNPSLECRNRAYSPIANDCTNFVSQALVAGGFVTNVHWQPYNSNWAYVQNLWSEMTTFGWINAVAKYSGSQLAASYTAGVRGDILMYDWGKGLRFSHMAMVTGWGSARHSTPPTVLGTLCLSTVPTAGVRRGITDIVTPTAALTEPT
jgi:hypothetical protein